MTIRLRSTARGVAMSLTNSGNTITDTLYAASRDTLFSAGTTTLQFVAIRDANGTITALKGTVLSASMEYSRSKK